MYVYLSNINNHIVLHTNIYISYDYYESPINDSDLQIPQKKRNQESDINLI
jgi:hypothetical protein